MRYAFYVLGICVLAGATFSTWLFWPLPDPRFDWREIADETFANGNCAVGNEILLVMAAHDTENVQDYFSRQTFEERCPDGYEVLPINGDLTTEQFAEYIENAGDILQNDYRYWEMFGVAGFEWAYARRLRGLMGRPPLAFRDMVIAYRCTLPLTFAEHGEWIDLRRMIHYRTGRDVLIPEWEARFAECRQRSEREVAWLRTHEHLTPEPEPDDVFEGVRGLHALLVERYEADIANWAPAPPPEAE